MSIASSARFDSNYVVGGGFFRSEDVCGTKARKMRNTTLARLRRGLSAVLLVPRQCGGVAGLPNYLWLPRAISFDLLLALTFFPLDPWLLFLL